MLIDTTPVSFWYALNKGFKVYTFCFLCKGTRLSYYRVWMKECRGIAVQCDDCGKQFPVRMKTIRKEKQLKAYYI